MGGQGSTRWRDYKRKRAVEDCLRLDTSKDLPPADLISARRAWGFDWSQAGVSGSCFLEYAQHPLYVVSWQRAGQDVTDTVELEATATFHGARRWWFRCPLCGRRVRSVYAPLGARFACLVCHNLSYACWQNNHERMLHRDKHHGEIYKLLDQAARLDMQMSQYTYWSKHNRRLFSRYAAILMRLYSEQAARSCPLLARALGPSVS